MTRGINVRPGAANEAARLFAKAQMLEAAAAARDGLADDENCYVAEFDHDIVGVVLGRLGNEVLGGDVWVLAGMVSYLGVIRTIAVKVSGADS